MTTSLTLERWNQFWSFYKEEPHQKTAIKTLYDQIQKADPQILTEEALWRQQFSNAPSLPTPPSTSNPLLVPHQSQLDNVSGQGARECFSSSCAMVAMYYGKVKNDDEYNKVRAKYGDTINNQAQVKALQSLGLKAEFKTTGTTQDLENLIRQGRPIPVGWLHHGPVSAPRGTGHWSVIIGFTSSHWIHNDPNGEANMVNGGYTNHSNGKAISYSRLNWDRRWRVNGTGGWYLDVSK